ncbi:uncharacterized protein [Haliotis cracherodii]|uniref:uncharacterized protein n=1 Tax=Haliotis cracherodii TaxID=6455 RepID=UPI0039E98C4C
MSSVLENNSDLQPESPLPMIFYTGLPTAEDAYTAAVEQLRADYYTKLDDLYTGSDQQPLSSSVITSSHLMAAGAQGGGPRPADRHIFRDSWHKYSEIQDNLSDANSSPNCPGAGWDGKVGRRSGNSVSGVYSEIHDDGTEPAIRERRSHYEYLNALHRPSEARSVTQTESGIYDIPNDPGIEVPIRRQAPSVIVDFFLIIGVILASAIAVTCAFTTKRRKLPFTHNPSGDVSVTSKSSQERNPNATQGSEPFYANVDNLKADPKQPSLSAGVSSSHTNTGRTKGTDTPPAPRNGSEPSSSMSVTQVHPSDVSRSTTCIGSRRGDPNTCPESTYSESQDDTQDTGLYSNYPFYRSHDSARLAQPDHNPHLDTQRESTIYVNTNVRYQGNNAPAAQADHYTYLDALHPLSTNSIPSEGDEYDLPYAFLGNRAVPVPKHDHYINIPSAKQKAKKKQKRKR